MTGQLTRQTSAQLPFSSAAARPGRAAAEENGKVLERPRLACQSSFHRRGVGGDSFQRLQPNSPHVRPH